MVSSAVTSAPPQPVGSSTASEIQPGPHTVVTPAATSRPPVEPITDNAVDSKIGITANIRRVAERRKVVQAMSGPAPEGSSGPIGRRVMQRRSLMHLLSSVTSHSRDVLVIPNNDVQQSEGIGGASHQPFVPVPISLSPGFSPSSLKGSPERLFQESAAIGVLHSAPPLP
ncbi:unnamed protein product [Lactuca virosa]|uniref:Uncharacterized protein n=1 Tax=Lactuca virosa TaxID=75947 RepID=A0AAU9NDG9_9ASTR|nr:unnamed protein product [Lactuca virosa]